MAIFIAVLAVIMVVVLSFKYPPISLLFFLTTSFFKTVLMVKFSFFLFFDYTVLCGLLVLVVMLYSFIRSGGRITGLISAPVGMFLLLAVILLLDVSYTSAPRYGWQKSTRFAVLGFIAFASSLFFSLQLKTVKQIIIILFIAGTVIAIGTIMAPHTAVIRRGAGGIRAGFLEANPLDSAMMMATTGIICSCFAFVRYTSARLKIISLLLLPVMLAGIVLTGSRGPFLGLGICVIIALFLCQKQLSKIAFPLVLIVLVGGLFFILAKFPEKETRRIETTLTGLYEIKEAAQSRTSRFHWVLSRVCKRPILGHGTGAFAVDWGGADERDYPHNIILELIYETGIVGLGVFALFMLLVFKKWLAARKLVRIYGLGPDVGGLVNIIGLLLFFTFLQSLKSYDIDGNRYMFFFCGLVLALFNCIRAECLNISFYDDEFGDSSLSYKEAEYFGDELIVNERL